MKIISIIANFIFILLALSNSETLLVYDALFQYIKYESNIKEGGSSIYDYESRTYVISVASLSVGDKNEQACKTVGSTKAKREMLSFINGSEITSYTQLKTSETVTNTLEGQKAEVKNEYVEFIKEKVIGTIDQCIPMGSWYSEDKSVYYYAIYKIVE